MKTLIVLVVASVLVAVVFWKFLIPLVWLSRGYGAEAPLPSWLIRTLSPRIAVLVGLFIGPVLVVLIVVGAWFAIRR